MATMTVAQLVSCMQQKTPVRVRGFDSSKPLYVRAVHTELRLVDVSLHKRNKWITPANLEDVLGPWAAGSAAEKDAGEAECVEAHAAGVSQSSTALQKLLGNVSHARPSRLDLGLTASTGGKGLSLAVRHDVRAAPAADALSALSEDDEAARDDGGAARNGLKAAITELGEGALVLTVRGHRAAADGAREWPGDVFVGVGVVAASPQGPCVAVTHLQLAGLLAAGSLLDVASRVAAAWVAHRANADLVARALDGRVDVAECVADLISFALDDCGSPHDGRYPSSSEVRIFSPHEPAHDLRDECLCILARDSTDLERECRVAAVDPNGDRTAAAAWHWLDRLVHVSRATVCVAAADRHKSGDDCSDATFTVLCGFNVDRCGGAQSDQPDELHVYGGGRRVAREDLDGALGATRHRSGLTVLVLDDCGFLGESPNEQVVKDATWARLLEEVSVVAAAYFDAALASGPLDVALEALAPRTVPRVGEAGYLKLHDANLLRYADGPPRFKVERPGEACSCRRLGDDDDDELMATAASVAPLAATRPPAGLAETAAAVPAEWPAVGKYVEAQFKGRALYYPATVESVKWTTVGELAQCGNAAAANLAKQSAGPGGAVKVYCVKWHANPHGREAHASFVAQQLRKPSAGRARQRTSRFGTATQDGGAAAAVAGPRAVAAARRKVPPVARPTTAPVAARPKALPVARKVAAPPSKAAAAPKPPMAPPEEPPQQSPVVSSPVVSTPKRQRPASTAETTTTARQAFAAAEATPETTWQVFTAAEMTPATTRPAFAVEKATASISRQAFAAATTTTSTTRATTARAAPAAAVPAAKSSAAPAPKRRRLVADDVVGMVAARDELLRITFDNEAYQQTFLRQPWAVSVRTCESPQKLLALAGVLEREGLKPEALFGLWLGNPSAVASRSKGDCSGMTRMQWRDKWQIRGAVCVFESLTWGGALEALRELDHYASDGHLIAKAPPEAGAALPPGALSRETAQALLGLLPEFDTQRFPTHSFLFPAVERGAVDAYVASPLAWQKREAAFEAWRKKPKGKVICASRSSNDIVGLQRTSTAFKGHLRSSKDIYGLQRTTQLEDQITSMVHVDLNKRGDAVVTVLKTPGLKLEVRPVVCDDARVHLRGQSAAYAKADLKHHEVLGLYSGALHETSEYHELRASSLLGYVNSERFAFNLTGDFVIDPFPGAGLDSGPGSLYGSELMAINDARHDAFASDAGVANCNCRFIQVDVCGWPHVFVEVTRPVAAGAELLIDYSAGYWATRRALESVAGPFRARHDAQGLADARNELVAALEHSARPSEPPSVARTERPSTPPSARPSRRDPDLSKGSDSPGTSRATAVQVSDNDLAALEHSRRDPRANFGLDNEPPARAGSTAATAVDVSDEDTSMDDS
ncbi:hypothetical protein M885DRAFT_521836 [Pelagophyceae sp. CCMP2097]|nr:hypothetical protein M885DRAFT_521836 [Pelagophyceae sp. CCMP2097]